MKLRVHRLEPSDVRKFRHIAAQRGWLYAGSDSVRAGFGDPIAKRSVSSLEELRSVDDLFTGLEVLDRDLLTAFAAVPFSRHEAFELVIPSVSMVVNKGQALALVAEGIDLASELDGTQAPEMIPGVVRFEYEPSPDQFASAVADAVERLRSGDLAKVVLARSVRGDFDTEVTTAAIAGRFGDLEPTCTIYSMPVSEGRRYTGASPELLVSRHGTAVLCHPLAGTIATRLGEDADLYNRWLLGSSKNLEEHRIVVDDIVHRLEPLATSVEADPKPSIVPLRSVTHLGTYIRAEARPDTTVMHLVRELHPTPAVGGLPREDAVDLIAKLETRDRGPYAGAVGWMNALGDGEWSVAIRGILTRSRHFEVWAGAGIVSESDPLAEREETGNKLASILRAIGIGTLN